MWERVEVLSSWSRVCVSCEVRTCQKRETLWFQSLISQKITDKLRAIAFLDFHNLTPRKAFYVRWLRKLCRITSKFIVYIYIVYLWASRTSCYVCFITFTKGSSKATWDCKDGPPPPPWLGQIPTFFSNEVPLQWDHKDRHCNLWNTSQLFNVFRKSRLMAPQFSKMNGYHKRKR